MDMGGVIGWRGRPGGRERGLWWVMPDMVAQRASGEKGEQNELGMDMELKGERRAPGVLNTFVVFLRFFHLARRF